MGNCSNKTKSPEIPDSALVAKKLFDAAAEREAARRALQAERVRRAESEVLRDWNATRPEIARAIKAGHERYEMTRHLHKKPVFWAHLWVYDPSVERTAALLRELNYQTIVSKRVITRSHGFKVGSAFMPTYESVTMRMRLLVFHLPGDAVELIENASKSDTKTFVEFAVRAPPARDALFEERECA